MNPQDLTVAARLTFAIEIQLILETWTSGTHAWEAGVSPVVEEKLT